MKKLVFTLLCAFGMFSTFAQVDREKVLIEVATGTWCVWCPSVARAVDDLHENGDPVAVIEYHNGDSFANAASNARNSYYSVSGYPNTQFDGSYQNYGGGSTGDLYPTFLNIVNTRMNIQTPFEVEISGDHDGDDYDITVTVTKVGTYTGTNLYVRFALTESHIPYNWFDMSEVNFVERLMVPDAQGTAVDFSGSDVVEVELSFTFNNSWDPDNCELVAFIQDDGNKAVPHSTSIMLNELGEGAPSFLADFHANKTDYCEAPVGVQFYSDCIGDPNAWNWTFEGGTPATSNLENPIIAYQEEGAYDVQLIISRGAQRDTAFQSKYITLHGLPDVTWDMVPELCNESWDPYLLTEGQPEGGVYSGNHIIDGMYFDASGLEAGEYPVTYTYEDPYGCENAAEYMVSVVNCVGIGEDQTLAMELYPNPTNGMLNISVSANEFNNAELSIINVIGKEIYRNKLAIDGSVATTVDLSEQPQGIYFVVIKGDEQSVTKKIFLNK